MTKKIVVKDYSDYIPGQSCTGGHYTYTTEYVPRENNKYLAIYRTSADFSYCPCCGSFEPLTGYNKEVGLPYCDWCKGHFDEFTAEQIKAKVEAIENDKNYEIIEVEL